MNSVEGLAEDELAVGIFNKLLTRFILLLLNEKKLDQNKLVDDEYVLSVLRENIDETEITKAQIQLHKNFQ